MSSANAYNLDKDKLLSSGNGLIELLCLLSIARNGLTESELNDILSCDDDVLNDVYTYWTPPVRRLPPLLLIRLRADLEEYIGK